ncbi:response regulator transcription factor [Tolypothrix sp. FACHB-123]|nr:response regulator transcription factor [Tolypothrix sp. FACHB-123]
MKTCQIEPFAAKKVSLCPPPSYADSKITEKWFGISVLHPQTVNIRAIDVQQRQQILEHPLTERELCILKMIVDGNSNLNISQKLYITIGTVKAHVRNIFNKLNVCDRTQATVLALRSGLVD